MANWFRPNVVECFSAFSRELYTEEKTRSEVSIAPDRDISARQRLGDGDDVGGQTPVLETEELAGPPEARLHLVEHQQRFVLAAELLGLSPVLRRGHVDALALNWFDDERGHVPFLQLLAQSSEISRRGRHQMPGSNAPKPSRNSAPPLSESAPVLSP